MCLKGPTFRLFSREELHVAPHQIRPSTITHHPHKQNTRPHFSLLPGPTPINPPLSIRIHFVANDLRACQTLCPVEHLRWICRSLQSHIQSTMTHPHSHITHFDVPMVDCIGRHHSNFRREIHLQKTTFSLMAYALSFVLLPKSNT